MNETAFSFDPDWMGTLTAPFMTTLSSPACASPWPLE